MVGATVRFNVSGDWSMMTIDGYVANQTYYPSGGLPRGGADDAFPTGGATAPGGGAVDGSSFAANVDAFDDHAMVHMIGCPELKYDDGGYCAC